VDLADQVEPAAERIDQLLRLARVPQAEERKPRERRHRPGAERLVALLADVIEEKAEARHVLRERPEGGLVEVDQLLEGRRRGPALLGVVQHEGEDRRQARCVGVEAEVVLPDPDEVDQDPEGHQGVVGALVLEQEIDQHRLGAAADRKENVAVPAPQGLVDEAAGGDGERAPGEAGREVGAQDVAQLAGRVLGVREDGADEGVVGVGGLHGATMPEVRVGGTFLGSTGCLPV